MKKLKAIILPVCLVLAGTVGFVGCTKNDSKFYNDDEADGLAIFSNTENNVMSCYVNGEVWQTVPRITSILGLYGTDYEVGLSRTPVSNISDVVQINWQGYYKKDRNATSDINLQLLIPRNSFRRYINSLQGKRIAIDSSAGNYFTVSNNLAALNNRKANGSIYFHTMQIDSVGPDNFTGKMSGIFEADFGTGKITKGRFDHVLTQRQIR